MSAPTTLINRRHFVSMGLGVAAAPLTLGALLPHPAQAASAPLGAYQPKFWRWKIGAFEMTAISDSEAFIDGPFPLIGKNASEREVRDLMRTNLLPETKYQPAFSPTIVNTGSKTILFDTGNGANGFIPKPKGGWLAAGLGPAGFKADDIDIVVLTHGHPDHVGGLIEDGPLFRNASYVIGRTEYEFWSPEGGHSGDLAKFAAVFRANTAPLADKFRFIEPGEAEFARWRRSAIRQATSSSCSNRRARKFYSGRIARITTSRP